jgi:hypothetical protein
MRSLLSVLLVVLFCSVSYGQEYEYGAYGYGVYGGDEPLADLNATWYERNSLMNPYGAGSRYHPDSLMNPYGRYGSRYSNESWRNPYATNAPRLYARDGEYLGQLSSNRYMPDSTSNPYGRHGSRFSQRSINNPYGAGNPHSRTPIYVKPSKR